MNAQVPHRCAYLVPEGGASEQFRQPMDVEVKRAEGDTQHQQAEIVKFGKRTELHRANVERKSENRNSKSETRKFRGQRRRIAVRGVRLARASKKLTVR